MGSIRPTCLLGDEEAAEGGDDQYIEETLEGDLEAFKSPVV